MLNKQATCTINFFFYKQEYKQKRKRNAKTCQKNAIKRITSVRTENYFVQGVCCLTNVFIFINKSLVKINVVRA